MWFCSSLGSPPPIDLSDDEGDDALGWTTVLRSKGGIAKSTSIPNHSEVISIHDSDSDCVVTQIPYCTKIRPDWFKEALKETNIVESQHAHTNRQTSTQLPLPIAIER
jgi:hypothetical protein